MENPETTNKLVNDYEIVLSTRIKRLIRTNSIYREVPQLMMFRKWNQKKLSSLDTNLLSTLTEFRNGMTARNQSYWLSHFSLIPDVFNFDSVPKNSEQRESYLRELFQFSITAMIVGDDALAKKLAVFVWVQLYGNPTLHYSLDAIVISYILERIVSKRNSVRILKKASRIQNEELIRSVMFIEAHDLYLLCATRIPEMVNPENRLAATSFSSKASSVHDYQIVGDQFVRIAKLLLLRGDYGAARSFAEDAVNLYKMSDEVSFTGGRGCEDPFESRERSKSFILQAQLLMQITKLVMQLKSNALEGIQDLISDILQKLDIFYSRYLNPRDKVESNLGFVEELEWALILHHLFYIFFGMQVSDCMEDIFRDYLG